MLPLPTPYCSSKDCSANTHFYWLHCLPADSCSSDAIGKSFALKWRTVVVLSVCLLLIGFSTSEAGNLVSQIYVAQVPSSVQSSGLSVPEERASSGKTPFNKEISTSSDHWQPAPTPQAYPVPPVRKHPVLHPIKRKLATHTPRPYAPDDFRYRYYNPQPWPKPYSWGHFGATSHRQANKHRGYTGQDKDWIFSGGPR